VGELGGVSGLLAVHALPARHEFSRLLGVVVDDHLGPQGGVADDEQVGKDIPGSTMLPQAALTF
jgi:hypothetical protein